MASNGRKVTSARQIDANRRNAARSTGPKSRRGKEVVKWNALKHGLFAKEVLLPGEDSHEFQELSERLYADLRPDDAIETTLVEQLVSGIWRLRRLWRVEAGVFENEISRAFRDREEEGQSRDDELARLLQPPAAPSDAERRTAVENAGAAEWGAAFLRDANRGNAFSKLARCETSVERSVFKALHELQRLQSARLGGPAAVPVAADVDVSISGH